MAEATAIEEETGETIEEETETEETETATETEIGGGKGRWSVDIWTGTGKERYNIINSAQSSSFRVLFLLGKGLIFRAKLCFGRDVN